MIRSSPRPTVVPLPRCSQQAAARSGQRSPGPCGRSSQPETPRNSTLGLLAGGPALEVEALAAPGGGRPLTRRVDQLVLPAVPMGESHLGQQDADAAPGGDDEVGQGRLLDEPLVAEQAERGREGEPAGRVRRRSGERPGGLLERPGLRGGRGAFVGTEREEFAHAEATAPGSETHAGGDVPGAAKAVLVVECVAEKEPVDGGGLFRIGRRRAEQVAGRRAGVAGREDVLVGGGVEVVQGGAPDAAEQGHGGLHAGRVQPQAARQHDDRSESGGKVGGDGHGGLHSVRVHSPAPHVIFTNVARSSHLLHEPPWPGGRLGIVDETIESHASRVESPIKS